MIIKKILNSIWNEFVYGGHLLSFGASGILWSSAIIFGQAPSMPLLLSGYAISQIVYGYNHFEEAEKDASTNPERVNHIKKIRKHIFPFLVFYFLLFVISLLYLKNLEAILVSLFILIGGIFFTGIFKSFTKQIIGFKTFYTSFFWAFLTILAYSYYHIQNNLLIFLLFSFVFLRWLLNTAFFDIKDVDSDKKEGLKTFPIILGKKKILIHLHLLNALSFSPIITGAYYGILPLSTLSLCLFYFYSFYYLKKAKEENIRKLSYVMVDGEYLLWPVVLSLAAFF